MKINDIDFPDPVLGEGRKLGAATVTTQALDGTLRTYVRTFGETHTLTFDRLTMDKYVTLLNLLDSTITITGIINGTFICLTNPVEGTEGRYFWSLTITLRKQ